MDQDLLRLVEHVIASATDLLACHAVILIAISADWLKCVRLSIDRLYQAVMLGLGCKTYYAPASCYLCCSPYAATAWCVHQYGLQGSSFQYVIALVGALNIVRSLTNTQTNLDD